MADFVPVAEFVPYHEAFPMAGRLCADGIDARVITQGDPLFPYHAPSSRNVVYCVIVPAPAADRARWILASIDPGRVT